MKLTNLIRDAFVRAVMDDVPSIDYAEQLRNKAVELAVARLPANVRAVWDNKETRPFIRMERSWRREGTVYVPWIGGGEDVIWNAEEEQQLSAIETLLRQQDESREKLEQKVRAVAYSCTTDKQLLEKLPEFEKYLPKEFKASRDVPAIANLVKDLVEAGWPDGGKKQTETETAEA